MLGSEAPKPPAISQSDLIAAKARGLLAAAYHDSNQQTGELDGNGVGQDDLWCWSCYRPLIPGLDDLAILGNCQTRESYKVSGISRRSLSVAVMTFGDRWRLSAKHLRTAGQHLCFALQILLPRRKNFAIRAWE